MAASDKEPADFLLPLLHIIHQFNFILEQLQLQSVSVSQQRLTHLTSFVNVSVRYSTGACDQFNAECSVMPPMYNHTGFCFALGVCGSTSSCVRSPHSSQLSEAKLLPQLPSLHCPAPFPYLGLYSSVSSELFVCRCCTFLRAPVDSNACCRITSTALSRIPSFIQLGQLNLSLQMLWTQTVKCNKHFISNKGICVS